MELVTPKSIGQIERLRRISKKSLREVTRLHEKFRREIRDCEKDKDVLLHKIKCLLDAEEGVLLDLSIQCQTLELRQLSNSILKMHVQKLSLIKWIFSISHTSSENAPKFQEETANVSLEEIKSQKNKNMSEAEYFKLKENSKFMAKGIQEELDNISNQIKREESQNSKILALALKDRKSVQSIEPSQKQEVLLETIQFFANQSQSFKRFTAKTSQHFQQTFKDLNVHQYSKIKAEVDEGLTSRIVQVSSHLSKHIHNYLRDNIAKIRNKGMMVSRGDQANFNLEVVQKFKIQIKKKDEEITELKLQLNLQKNQVINLERLTQENQQKMNALEQKIRKLKFEKQERQKQSQYHLQIGYSSKSRKNDQPQQTDRTEEIINRKSQILSVQIIDESAPVENNTTVKVTSRKKVLKQRILQKRYQKSLKRIKKKYSFEQEDPIEDSFVLGSPQKEKNIQFEGITNKSMIEKMYICSQFHIDYTPESIKFKQIRLGKANLCFCSNVYAVEENNEINWRNYKEKGRITHRRDSLLTVRNVAKISFGSLQKATRNGKFSTFKKGSKQTSIFEQQKQFLQLRQSLLKQLQQQKKKKKNNMGEDQMSQKDDSSVQSCSNQENKRENLYLKRKDRPVSSGLIMKIKKLDINAMTQTIQTKKKDISYKDPKNTFEIMNFTNTSTFGKSNSRFNMMNLTGQKNNKLIAKKIRNLIGEKQTNEAKDFGVEDILQLYLNIENAMEAEIAYGISVAPVVIYKNNVARDSQQYNPRATSPLPKLGKIEEIHKQLQKRIFNLRKNNPQLFRKVHNLLRYPYTCLKSQINLDSQQLNANISLKVIVQFIVSLHEQCDDCLHFEHFISKLSKKSN